jgi:hypothetical protein
LSKFDAVGEAGDDDDDDDSRDDSRESDIERRQTEARADQIQLKVLKEKGYIYQVVERCERRGLRGGAAHSGHQESSPIRRAVHCLGACWKMVGDGGKVEETN